MTKQTTPDILAGMGQGDGDAVMAAMGPQVMALDIAVIRLDGGTQPRAGIDRAVVEDYANDMESNGAEFPPVQVVYDGEAYWLWDGFHRLHARKLNGLHTAPAIVRQGTRRDAVLLSVGANATHGFRRTNEDKRRAVLALLHDEEWVAWSDREIARRCAVSHQFVSNVRAGLSVNDGQIAKERRVLRNGTEYTMAPAQRAPGAAVEAQGVKWMTTDELVVALREWSGAFEDKVTALDGLRADWVNGQGSYMDDWENTAPTVWEPHDLLAAIRLIKEGMDGMDKGMDGAAIERARDPLPAPKPYDLFELVEELVALESVALDGVDEAWLFEYMEGMARRKNRMFDRRMFDAALRDAVRRQIADNERRQRLETARNQAMAMDRERAAAGAGGMEFEVKRINQGRTVKIFGRNMDGTLTATVDGEKLHLYSPGMTMTLADAYGLVTRMDSALREMRNAKMKEADHA